MSLFSSLQDPEKVATFQRLCGVRLGPGSLAQVGDAAGLANGVCPAQAHADGAGGGRHRFPGAASQADEKGGLGPSDATKETEEAREAESQDKAKPVDSWGSKRQPRRNSLTGESVCQEFSVTNLFLYYLFSLGTELGNELFYFLFFPFCFWNTSPWLGRRLMLVWVWVMYLGQCTKDVLRWPRPASPPVVKLEVFYNSEYSMPSTHAMSGTAVPVVLFLCSYKLWQYHFMYGLILVFCWCSLVCFSRIYMGMHSILDVIAGVLFALLILAVFLPTVDLIDSFTLTFKYAPLIIISLHLALGIFSFTLDTWSTSRGDTAQILGCGAGVACGSRVMYMLSLTTDLSPEMLPLLLPPLTVTLVGKTMLRLLIGVVILFLTKAVMKKVTIPLACKIFSIPCDDIRQARQRMEVELPYRYITYGMVGFSLSFLVPALFHVMGLS